MESVQREILSVLLGRVLALGLISNFTYQSAENSVHSVIDLPDCFGYAVCLEKEATTLGSTQNAG